MLRYTLRRLIQLIPTVLGLVIVVFLVLRLAPGDPAVTALGENPTAETVERLREKMGLNQSVLPALIDYLGGMVRGDLGDSIVEPRSVAEIIRHSLPVTVVVATAALVFSVIFGVVLGTTTAYLASKGRSALDHILTGTLLPEMSSEFLTRMAEGKTIEKVNVTVDGTGKFVYQIS